MIWEFGKLELPWDLELGFWDFTVIVTLVTRA
jgi:hypothetical protein